MLGKYFNYGVLGEMHSIMGEPNVICMYICNEKSLWFVACVVFDAVLASQ